MNFEREERYIVLKIKDVKEALTAKELKELSELLCIVRWHRRKKAKQDLKCVVVESDWPEYESTWQAIEKRMTGGVNESRN